MYQKQCWRYKDEQDMMSVIEEEMPLVASNSHDQKLPVRESQRWLLRCSHLHDFHSFWSQCQITEIVCHWERREPPSQTNQRAFGKGLSWNVCFSVEHMPKLLSPKKTMLGQIQNWILTTGRSHLSNKRMPPTVSLQGWYISPKTPLLWDTMVTAT